MKKLLKYIKEKLQKKYRYRYSFTEVTRSNDKEFGDIMHEYTSKIYNKHIRAAEKEIEQGLRKIKAAVEEKKNVTVTLDLEEGFK